MTAVALPNAPAAPPHATATYVAAEVRRTLRNTRFLVFAIALPLVLFFVIASSDDGSTLDGLRLVPYIMVSMATLGAMSAVIATSSRIAQDRSTGWHRQLRLTSLTGPQYVLGKAVTGFTVAVPALAGVFLAAALIEDVHLPALRWLGIGAAVLVALMPMAALGIWLGYVVRGDNLQAIAGGVYSLLALAGGLYVPLESFPSAVQHVARALPMAWVAASGRDALQGAWVGWHGAAVLALWTLVLGGLAARAYGRDAARA